MSRFLSFSAGSNQNCGNSDIFLLPFSLMSPGFGSCFTLVVSSRMLPLVIYSVKNSFSVRGYFICSAELSRHHLGVDRRLILVWIWWK